MSGWDRSDPARQEQVREIFLTVLDASAQEREAVLEDSCGWDGELRLEIEELLAAGQDADDALWSLARRARGPLTDRPGGFAEGRLLGAYRLLRQIGEGGMGAVYLAERADGEFRKQVAVKLLPIGLNTGAARERFLAERQILAQLEHPGIARLLDAGIAEDGTPFFVMEYVEGEPIDRYCERRDLGIAERIDLFLQVCGAVEYAHRNLVVHRDLKPANILVATDGTAKLLDFGIAKVLDGGAVSGTMALTQQAGRPMTPAYASPEQVRGEPITTATDVYALGVLLYQLLSGHAPYEVHGLSPTDLERLICTQEPITPSAAALGRAAQPGSGPIPVSTAASKRARRLRGDLDTIVLMALRKEPERRYRSVAALADDLVRHREGRPVSARSSRFSYTAEKFVRRRPAAVMAGALLMFAVTAFSVTLFVHAGRLEHERNVAQVERARAEELQQEAEAERSVAQDERVRAEEERGRAESAGMLAESQRDRAAAAETRARAERDRAEVALRESLVQTGRAEATSKLVVSLFRAAQPGTEARGDTVSARTLLERGAERVRAELVDQPEIALELLWTIGDIQDDLGMFAESTRLFDEVVATSRHLHGPDSPIVAEQLARIGMLHLRRRAFRLAETHLEEAAGILRRQSARDPLALAAVLRGLALAHRENGTPDRAESVIREAIALYRIHVPENHTDLRAAKHRLAQALRSLDRWHEAERLYRELLAQAAEDPNASAMTTAGLQNDLAYLLRLKEEYPEAERLYRKALAATRQSAGPAAPMGAMTANNLASVLGLQGNIAEAEALLLDEVALHRAHFPENHWRIGQSVSTLAGFYRVEEQYAAAEPWTLEAIDIYETALGADHGWTLMAKVNLARVLIRLERVQEAEQHLLAAYQTPHTAEMTPQRREATRAVLESLVDLYETLSDSEQAARYRLVLEDRIRTDAP
jgi:eukaryotic-like serine/threonine-protein kinase